MAKLTLKQEAEMVAAVEQIKEIEAAENKLKKQADELKSKLKATMEKKHLEEVDVGIYTVRYKEVISQKFDSKAFRETHEALFYQYLVESAAKRFSIS